jgi:Domain of unknown function (DUF4913)
MTFPDGPSGGAPEQPDEHQDAPEPVFGSAGDWVSSYFRPMFIRPLGGEFRWCPQWRAHPEAVTRLTALWRSWEVFRLEPATGISDWFRDHLDHHLPILLGARGPFFQCDPQSGHLDGKPFPADPVDYEVLDGDGMTAPDGAAGGEAGS